MIKKARKGVLGQTVRMGKRKKNTFNQIQDT